LLFYLLKAGIAMWIKVMGFILLVLGVILAVAGVADEPSNWVMIIGGVVLVLIGAAMMNALEFVFDIFDDVF